MNSQLRETVKAIDHKAVAKKIAREAGSAVARVRREFSEQFNSTVVAHTTGADKNDPAAQAGGRVSGQRTVKAGDMKVGDKVMLKSLGREARVERVIDSKTFEVMVGTMKMRVAIADIAEVTPVAVDDPAEAARRRGGITVQMSTDSDSVPMEINVIGRTAEEAQDEVSRYLERAFMAGLPHIRIVHGTGMGVLRRTLREFLKNHPQVTSVRAAARSRWAGRDRGGGCGSEVGAQHIPRICARPLRWLPSRMHSTSQSCCQIVPSQSHEFGHHRDCRTTP